MFKVYCTKCGEELSESSKFCTKCGTPVAREVTKPEVKEPEVKEQEVKEPEVKAPEAKEPEVKPVSSVVEKFEKDTDLQSHWIMRIIAYIIDSVIVSIATGILSAIVMLPFVLGGPFGVGNPWGLFGNFNFQFAVGGLSVIYFIFAETFYGTTIGKNLMGLKVVTTSGERISLEKAFIRNISKLVPVLPILDVIGGVLTSTDLHQKYSDRLANTTVVSVTESAVKA